MSVQATEPLVSSALEYQQTTNSRIVVEENFLRFFTGGEERMTIDANGNVGIGTTNPNYPLSIRSDKGISDDSHDLVSFSRFKSGSGNAGLNISYEADGSAVTRTQLYFPGGVGATFQTYSQGLLDVLHLGADGNVGIGTTDPKAKLNVSGSTLVQGTVKIDQTSPNKGAALLYFYDRSYHNSTDRNWKIATLPANSAGSGDRLLIEIFGGLYPSNNSYQATIHVGNRAGFNGFIPAVYGKPQASIRIRAYNQPDGTVDIYLSLLSYSYKGAGIRIYEGSGINEHRPIIYQNPENVGANPSGSLVFDSYTATPGMAIQRGGTIGINTSDPDEAYELHVAGKIRATHYKSDANSYADFVFEDDYALPTLSEVERFIEKNNHLPDIPSEAEAKANGIDLQEMQAKLLQKIEELTLYVIDLKKENESQSDLLNAQQKRIQQLEKGKN